MSTVDEVRSRLEEVIDVGYVDEDDSETYYRDVREALHELAGLIRQGRADQVIELAAHTISLLDHTDIDDEGGVDDLFARTQEIHLDACLAGTPDPVALAESLVAMALNTENTLFTDLLQD
ncbi:hypothetical protein [Actinokineospora globicatena]|uniref:Uncharacterized protein n=1 Tax=Actinokineospora globicatena TaxID=103729 RepID=A0A9W6QUQ7_9PSEU|nr:hypothetical protein [Actinokineospora globicatena]GLW94964.1 hypothetical protein Aglo03_57800 [Actinokineospora globicatena]